MADPEEPMGDDPFIRAGEYALGLLEGEERAAAAREMLAGGEFAETVAWWQRSLAPLAEEAGVATPDERLWLAIESRLDGEERSEEIPLRPDPVDQRDGLGGWRLALALAGTAAVAAALALVLVPSGGAGPATAPISAEPTEQLIAQIQSEDGALSLASRFVPESDTLAVRLAGFAPPDPATQSAELWVVPEGGDPVSLGLVPSDGQVEQPLTAAQQALLAEGALLAVTYESRDGAPHAAPSTEILLAGPLTQL